MQPDRHRASLSLSVSANRYFINLSRNVCGGPRFPQFSLCRWQQRNGRHVSNWNFLSFPFLFLTTGTFSSGGKESYTSTIVFPPFFVRENKRPTFSLFPLCVGKDITTFRPLFRDRRPFALSARRSILSPTYFSGFDGRRMGKEEKLKNFRGSILLQQGRMGRKQGGGEIKRNFRFCA